jgi:hypothetical protein
MNWHILIIVLLALNVGISSSAHGGLGWAAALLAYAAFCTCQETPTEKGDQ